MNARETLALTGTSIATTYHFRSAEGCGWACCTVNDTTGELQIMSDWGDWSYRWHVTALWPASNTDAPLTRFLADPGHKHDHYLADKLTSSDRSKREHFDPEKTVAALREFLVERFRDNGGVLRKIQRANIFADTYERDRWVPMSRREFAVLYKALGALEHIDDQRDFVAAFEEIENHETVASEPWEFFSTSPTSSYLVLLRAIVPALVDACTERVRQLGAPTTPHEATTP